MDERIMFFCDGYGDCGVKGRILCGIYLQERAPFRH